MAIADRHSPEECTAFFKTEMAKWGKVIKDAGLKAEEFSAIHVFRFAQRTT